ncbi:hypothetical protein [Rhizobium sp. BK377]|uniref:hypothetical protein n=1 Tax=Rhizobium sp. BK377 TaxID=2587058 RepID=UPI00160D4986|nr:hypothetical protein [Rhizobium sp. BK377]MBB3461962.1 hypothetical protein [Rhizobium sp. BK377]
MTGKRKSIATSGGVPFGVAIAAEVLSAIQVPGGSVLADFVDRYQEKKRAEARDLLIEEISAGRHGPVDFDADDMDPFIAATLRFAKAVEIGAAHENLKLLAQVIAGLKRNKALSADTFMRWAGVLEGMTRDELMMLGMAYRAQRIYEQAQQGENATVWPQLISSMTNAGYSAGEIASLAACVSRYGLLTLSTGFGGVAGYEPSSWLMELGELADLNVVMARESRA